MSAANETSNAPVRAIAGVILFVAVGFGGAIWAFLASIDYLRVRHAPPAALIAASFIYGAALLLLAVVFARTCRKLSRRKPSLAARRYVRRFMTTMGVYAFAMLAAANVYRYMKPTGLLAYGLAIAPSLPLIASIGVIGVYLREETDEFERAIQTEAALWATGGLLALATTWGFLEMFRLVPHVESWWAFSLWAVLLGPGQVLARRRYR